ncbi:MAG TPA: 50S ribosomal protein L18 [Candidatus Moranbacteria bacterium]|nr:50S ribosomal protein L18 [Candidatus Moranbacteria bacterium]
MNRNTARLRRKKRAEVPGTAKRPRLSVYRSLRKIEAQIIDDEAGKTLVSAQSSETGMKDFDLKAAEKLGAILAEKTKKAGITEIVFDRSGYKYHGKVKALAEGMRKGGINF